MSKLLKTAVTLVLTIILLAVFVLSDRAVLSTGDVAESETTTDSSSQPVEQKPAEKQLSVTIKDGKNLLTEQEKDVLSRYAAMYLETLAELKERPVGSLFTDPDGENATLNNTAQWTIATVRGMSSSDLELEYGSIEYDVQTVSYSQQGKKVYLLENNVQKFSFLSQPSQNFIIQHEFVLTTQDNVCTIKSHHQEEDFFLLTEEAWEKFSGTPLEIATKVRDAIVADTQENILWQQDNYLNKTEEKTAADTSYNRDKAVEYAMQWVGQRNYTGVYLAYDEYGGNCQNFASQCLYAGGLDMDIKGYSQWKFYSKTLNEKATATGRSYSWTGVEPFYQYCRDNTTGGIVAHTDWGIAYAQKGDIIQVGALGQWRHSIVVTDVVTDGEGHAKEIVVASNTADRINYPLSAYIYTAPRLIHIVGQN